MNPLEDLPNFPLRLVGDVADRFLACGVTDYHGAARYVQRLPYGRNTDRANFRLVLREGRGTCSTKHALLAQLAKEQAAGIGLAIGIYEMTQRNTPGVGPVLAEHDLPFLPEAHCYLTYAGARVDVTRATVTPSESIMRFLYEETIRPDQIGKYKTELHRRFIQDWVATSKLVRGRTWHEIWRIRERCIAALSE